MVLDFSFSLNMDIYQSFFSSFVPSASKTTYERVLYVLIASNQYLHHAQISRIVAFRDLHGNHALVFYHQATIIVPHTR